MIGCTNEWMNEWPNERTNDLTNERTNERTNEYFISQHRYINVDNTRKTGVPHRTLVGHILQSRQTDWRCIITRGKQKKRIACDVRKTAQHKWTSTNHYISQLEETSTHKSAETHPRNAFCASWFPGLMVEHFYVKSDDPIAASVSEISCGKTDKHTNGGEHLTPASAVAVRNRTTLEISLSMESIISVYLLTNNHFNLF